MRDGQPLKERREAKKGGIISKGQEKDENCNAGRETLPEEGRTV